MSVFTALDFVVQSLLRWLLYVLYFCLRITNRRRRTVLMGMLTGGAGLIIVGIIVSMFVRFANHRLLTVGVMAGFVVVMALVTRSLSGMRATYQGHEIKADTAVMLAMEPALRLVLLVLIGVCAVVPLRIDMFQMLFLSAFAMLALSSYVAVIPPRGMASVTSEILAAAIADVSEG